jgi:class 3 adenylate cyclase/tetratricopeptide (TPR) repeat protein
MTFMSTLVDRPASHAAGETLKPYVPRLLIEWLKETPEARHRAVDGSLVFVDISGFTALTERLARRGKIGAELMRDTLDGVFTALLDEAYDWGAGLLKWGGDALLLLFDGPGHAPRAARAAWEMQRTIERVGRLRVSGGTVTLRMSIGIATGKLDFFVAGSVHRELLITGPGATETVTIEATADAGEIGISHALAALLDPACAGPAKGEALLLVAPPDVLRERAPDVGSVSGIDIASCIPIAARAHVLLERSEPEHRTITAAFIDLMDTDALLAELGPEEFAAALDERISSIEEAALRLDVPFYETDVGTGSVKALLTAGAPSSTGHDEERMLRALREIMDRPGIIPMRIGVNTGKVFTGDFGPTYRRAYRVFGDAINTAARVMSKATAGQILSTEIVLERSRTTFETTSIEPFKAKGKAAPVRASIVGPVIGVKDDRRAGVALIGREAELAALLGMIDEVRSGRGWIIEVSGGAGIGKSRLVDELIERSGDVVVLRARCEEYESATPYFALRGPMRTVLGLDAEADSDEVERRLTEVVQRVDPTLAPWLPLIGILLGLELAPTPETRNLDGQFLREQLAEAAMRFLVSALAGTPTMLAVEDVHFIDEASTDLLLRLSRAGSALRQVLLVTHSRPGTVWAPTDDDDLRCLAFTLVSLPARLMAEIVEHVTDDEPLAPHVVEEIVRRSGGNALFLLELLDAVRATGSVDGLPDSVESVIAGQIDRLSPSDRTVLRYASVLGASFHPTLLEAAVSEEVELDQEIWDRLDEFVDPEAGGMLRFRNTLVRDAAYEGLPYRRRRVLHERVGETIEAHSGVSLEEEIGALALHFHEAQRYDKAWDYCRRAGERAMEIYANVDAVRFFERAISAGRRLRTIEASQLGGAYEALGDTRLRLGEFEKATEALRLARRRALPSPTDSSRLLLKESRIAAFRGSYPQALRTATRGLNLLADVDAGEGGAQRAGLYGWYAAVRFRQGHLRDAVRWCERAEAEAERSGAAIALAHAFVIHDIALFMLGDTAMAHHARAVAIFEANGELGEKANALSNLGNAAYEQSRWTEAVELYESARSTWLATGNRWSAALPSYNIGEILSDQGRYEEAESVLRDVLRVWRASGARSEIADVTRQLGRLEARRGNFHDARRLLDAAHADLERGGEQLEAVATDAQLAECLVLAGETSAAQLLAADAASRAGTMEGAASLLPLLRRVRGWAYVQAGDLDEADDMFESGLALARERSSDFEVAMALEGLAEVRRQRGTPADDLIAERSNILERLGIERTPLVPVGPTANHP